MSGKLERICSVAFAEKSLEAAFKELKSGEFEEKELYNSLETVILRLKENPCCGKKIPSKIWPKEYVKKYRINNLWKYNLLSGWRLIYSVRGNQLEIVSVIIEWFSHKDYEKRFGYV